MLQAPWRTRWRWFYSLLRAHVAELPSQQLRRRWPPRAGQLTGLELADTTIANAELVQAGEFTDPDGATHDVPSFCRVVGVTSPEINFEVWLPQENWNGKFQGIGNGGMAGSFYFDRMTTALKRGYAAAATDTGHVSDGTFDATWGFGRPSWSTISATVDSI